MNAQWWKEPAAPLDDAVALTATARQQQLTKPPGSLGRLEDLAVHLAAMQGTANPRLDTICISVFAADHGVADEGVSAFPQAVTTEMVRNFASGGAAISVLARTLGMTLEVVDVGTVEDPGPQSGVINQRVAPGTANFVNGPAMSPEQLERSLAVGREAAQRAHAAGAQLFIAGDMGIANTTAATALACAYLNQPAHALTGPGTGLSPQGVAHKVDIIHRALELHDSALENPFEVLACLGGLEIAAMAGAYMACAQQGLPVLVDGFIATAAALAAYHLCPGVSSWLLYAHASAEPGHSKMLAALGAKPLLDLNMRLGEGSGAAVAVPLLKLAVALHNGMATFAEAGVSEKEK